MIQHKIEMNTYISVVLMGFVLAMSLEFCSERNFKDLKAKAAYAMGERKKEKKELVEDEA